MRTASLAPKTEAEVWLSILHPDEELSPRLARAIVGLSFPKAEVSRMHELSAKARGGTLTPEEHQFDSRPRVPVSTSRRLRRSVLPRPRDARNLHFSLTARYNYHPW